jgi:hypothetical protein
LLILDTAAAEIVYWEKNAHDNAIWSIDICHSKIVDGSDTSTAIVTVPPTKWSSFGLWSGKEMTMTTTRTRSCIMALPW